MTAERLCADAGIVGECTDFDVWVACKGSVMPVITVEGRQWHAELPTPHWSEGGAVNAIDKAMVVLRAVKTLAEEWSNRPDMRHEHLSPAKVLPVKICGGSWLVMYPPSCTIILNVQYPPGALDEQGTGAGLQREIEEWIDAAASADPWLREHPLKWEWMEDIIPYELKADAPIVDVCLGAAAELGYKGRITGIDSYVHAAAFTRAGTPSISFGPGHASEAHSIDEKMPIRELVDGCAAFALAYMRWCGVA